MAATFAVVDLSVCTTVKSVRPTTLAACDLDLRFAVAVTGTVGTGGRWSVFSVVPKIIVRFILVTQVRSPKLSLSSLHFHRLGRAALKV